MSSRKTRAAIARQTVEILERGEYSLPSGEVVGIADGVKAAREGTVLYTPQRLCDLLDKMDASNKAGTLRTVENCTTLAAAKRLVDEGEHNPLCLNFASAKNPGGGFLNGSQAQEESLARASGLYACIHPVDAYYDANRRCRSSLYTHHMIYSPKVPVFRDDPDQLLTTPYSVSIVTAPAVNAGAVRQNEPQNTHLIEPTMRERIERVLAIAVERGHRAIVLGAWGCGVFQNDPVRVAGWFHRLLIDDDRFVGAFRQVVFAVLDRSPRLETFAAFANRFG